MAEYREEHIRLWHTDGREHNLIVVFSTTPSNALIAAAYESGSANIKKETQVARWTAVYEPPAYRDGELCDKGYVELCGNGRIDIDVDCLRGIGVGSLLMLPLVTWAKKQEGNVPVVPINLQGQDANTEVKRVRRNKFYEKLGFEFYFHDHEEKFGESKPMQASQLIIPTFKMSGEWKVESVSATGNVF